MTTTGQDIMPADAPLSREAYTLLAQANLLRMRGCWEDAVEKCMAALRLAPDSASAQSLLGDIYENQGRYDDAIQWYRMALDVNPDSPADKIKLERLLALHPRRADFERKQSSVVSAALPPTRAVRPPAEADRVLRGIAWLAAALFLAAAILGGIVMSKHRPTVNAVTTTPVVVAQPAPNPQPPSNTDTSGQDASGQNESQNAPAPASAPASPSADAADPTESALLQTLQQDSALTTQNITPLGVQIDPRQNSATVTVLCPSPASGASVRDALTHDAAAAALAGDQAQGDRIAAWTIRCLLPAPAGATAAQPSLAFVADTTSADISPLQANISTQAPAQILNAFHNVWWSPSVPQ